MLLLSAYISRESISAVLFELSPFQVKDKVFIEIPYESDSFFSINSIKQIEKLIVNELKIEEEDFKNMEKILISDDPSKVYSGWKYKHSVKEIIESVSGRLFHVDFSKHEDLFETNNKKLNYYANSIYYRKNLNSIITKEILKKEISNYWDKYNESKVNLKEIIISIKPFDKSHSKKYKKFIIKKFADICKQNKIIELTFDFGYFLVPIIAALIDQKKSPTEFFGQNPIHIDAKLVVIPGVLDDLQFEKKNKEIFTDTKIENDLLLAKIEEGEHIVIKSKNSRKKINLELLGCRDGIYLDTREKDVKQ